MKPVFRLAGVFIFALSVLKMNAQSLTADTGSLAVQVNMPTFLYEGDRLEVVAAITNHADTEQTGQLRLQLSDAATTSSVDGWFQNIFPVQYFTVGSGKTEQLRFPVEAPYLFQKTLRWEVRVLDAVRDSGVLTVLAINNYSDSGVINPQTRFKINKQLFLKRPGQARITPVRDTTTIHVGDSLKIHLSVIALQQAEGVQLTDALAAAFAPASNSTNPQLQRSAFQRQDSNGITLFIPVLRKGRSSFEYTVMATHAGVFNYGPAVLRVTTTLKKLAYGKASVVRIEE